MRGRNLAWTLGSAASVLSAGLLAAFVACSPPSAPAFEPNPFAVSLLAGVPVAAGLIDVSGRAYRGPILVDTGSALTTLAGAPTREVEGAVLRLFDSAIFPGFPAGTVERVRFPPTVLLQTPEGPIGPWPGAPGGAQTAIAGVLGGDLLASFAIELQYPSTGAGDVTVTLHRNEPLQDSDFACNCQPVIRYTLQGGGVFPNPDPNRGDTPYPATRILIDACLNPEASPTYASWTANPPSGPTGIDATLLLDTGSPALVLAASTASLLADPGVSGAVTVGLPDGALHGTLGTLSRVALVDRTVFDNQSDARGACTELYCTRWNELYNYCRARGLDCSVIAGNLGQRCPDRFHPPQGQTATGSTALVLLGNGPAANATQQLQYVRVPDEAPVLQALRNEVAPGGQEVSGLLGTTLLQRLHVEVDYPGNRLILGCGGGEDNTPGSPTCREQPGLPPDVSHVCCFQGAADPTCSPALASGDAAQPPSDGGTALTTCPTPP